jgi:hypothetical protein
MISALYVLRELYMRLNIEREMAGLPRVKPYEVFDLVGGSGSGG